MSVRQASDAATGSPSAPPSPAPTAIEALVRAQESCTQAWAAWYDEVVQAGARSFSNGTRAPGTAASAEMTAFLIKNQQAWLTAMTQVYFDVAGQLAALVATLTRGNSGGDRQGGSLP
jgi:hypothetical protein